MLCITTQVSDDYQSTIRSRFYSLLVVSAMTADGSQVKNYSLVPAGPVMQQVRHLSWDAGHCAVVIGSRVTLFRIEPPSSDGSVIFRSQGYSTISTLVLI